VNQQYLDAQPFAPKDAPSTSTLAVLITAYRPDPDLAIFPDLLNQRLSEKGIGAQVHIVDDGSESNYAAILEAAREHGAVIHRHAVNLGKGAATRTGLNAILVALPDVRIIVTLDASAGYCVQDIEKIAVAAVAEPGALHLGVRPDAHAPARARVAGLLTHHVTHFLTGVSLIDAQAGLRAIPRRLADLALRIPLNGDDFELECLVEFRREFGTALCIRQWPVQAVAGDGGHASQFDPLLDSMRIYFLFLRYCGGSILTLIVDNLVFMAAFARTGSIGWSIVLARFVAMFVSFYFNRKAVFKFRGRSAPAFLRFVALVAGLGTISYFATSFLSSSTNMAPSAAKLIVEGVLFFASFALNNTFVFSALADGSTGIAADDAVNESYRESSR
jgi:glycosyltransferase involved in cell wall biosynthesis